MPFLRAEVFTLSAREVMLALYRDECLSSLEVCSVRPWRVEARQFQGERQYRVLRDIAPETSAIVTVAGEYTNPEEAANACAELNAYDKRDMEDWT